MSELVDVIDDNGKLTGVVVDRQISDDFQLKRKEIVVFIINNKHQLLLQKRSNNKKYNPGKWAPLAGGVQFLENFRDASIREIKEQLGIKISKDDSCESSNS